MRQKAIHYRFPTDVNMFVYIGITVILIFRWSDFFRTYLYGIYEQKQQSATRTLLDRIVDPTVINLP